jgi:Na+/H+-dicarboxylate symporter
MASRGEGRESTGGETLAVILAIDWLLDPCRTTVNVLGDVFAAIYVDHLCRFSASEGSGPTSTQLEFT